MEMTSIVMYILEETVKNAGKNCREIRILHLSTNIVDW